MTTPSSQTAGRLVAVVVTHNRLSQLKITLARLLVATSDHLAAVLVVNNASDDGTAEWLATQTAPRLSVVTSHDNLGGAGGFEIGMRQAMERLAPDWIVVMDDDARPDDDCLPAFHAHPRNDHWGWAAAVFHPDGRVCDINRPSINPFWHRRIFLRTLMGGGRDGFHLSESDFHGTARREIDGSSFVGLFVSSDAVRKVGYPDGSLFIYGDDVLYTLGLRVAGGRIAFDPGLRFEHDFSTIASGERRFRPIWKCYYHHRNLLMVYRRAAGVFFWPALLVVVPKWVIKIRGHAGERRAFARLMSRAIWHGLRRKTDVPHGQVVEWGLTAPKARDDTA